jgi:hypothetical protein
MALVRHEYRPRHRWACLWQPGFPFLAPVRLAVHLVRLGQVLTNKRKSAPPYASRSAIWLALLTRAKSTNGLPVWPDSSRLSHDYFLWFGRAEL